MEAYMRETQEHTIQGNVYRIQPLGAKMGRKVMARLLKVCGPLLAVLAASEDGTDIDLSRVFDGLTDEAMDFIEGTFSGCTRFSPASNPDVEFLLKDHFDTHFAGHYGTMVRWLWACVQVNYGTFLGELGMSPAQLTSLLGAKSSTKASQTKPSGASSEQNSEAS